jgi:hypothetical protein
VNKKPKKLSKKEEQRLKELDHQQQALQGNLELDSEKVRAEVEDYRCEQMRVITDKVRPVEEVYTSARKRAERERDKAISDAHKKFAEVESAARTTKRQKLEAIEKEIENLGREVEERIKTKEAELNSAFNEKLRAIVQERQSIRQDEKPAAQAAS